MRSGGGLALCYRPGDSGTLLLISAHLLELRQIQRSVPRQAALGEHLQLGAIVNRQRPVYPGTQRSGYRVR